MIQRILDGPRDEKCERACDGDDSQRKGDDKQTGALVGSRQVLGRRMDPFLLVFGQLLQGGKHVALRGSEPLKQRVLCALEVPSLDLKEIFGIQRDEDITCIQGRLQQRLPLGRVDVRQHGVRVLLALLGQLPCFIDFRLHLDLVVHQQHVSGVGHRLSDARAPFFGFDDLGELRAADQAKAGIERSKSGDAQGYCGAQHDDHPAKCKHDAGAH